MDTSYLFSPDILGRAVTSSILIQSICLETVEKHKAPRSTVSWVRPVGAPPENLQQFLHPLSKGSQLNGIRSFRIQDNTGPSSRLMTTPPLQSPGPKQGRGKWQEPMTEIFCGKRKLVSEVRAPPPLCLHRRTSPFVSNKIFCIRFIAFYLWVHPLLNAPISSRHVCSIWRARFGEYVTKREDSRRFAPVSSARVRTFFSARSHITRRRLMLTVTMRVNLVSADPPHHSARLPLGRGLRVGHGSVLQRIQGARAPRLNYRVPHAWPGARSTGKISGRDTWVVLR